VPEVLGWCPVAFAMDYKPNQICRWSLGMKERVLSSKTIWVCASCYTCSTRCPNDIDIAKVMDWPPDGHSGRVPRRRRKWPSSTLLSWSPSAPTGGFTSFP
jgi:CO dehydrogenase/acetyl-CoA synthase alpha subunit